MVAIIGLPNVGKSSLLNRFLGSKLSIVTGAAQTTRERVVGIDTRDGSQIVFIDTPGLVDPAYLLHHSMLEIALGAIGDADVVVLLLDGMRAFPDFPDAVRAGLGRLGSRFLVAINKEDAATPEALGELRRRTASEFGTEAVELSAMTGAGVEALRARIAGLLPVSPYLYPEDELSTQTVRFFVAELIRETVFEHFREEVPYSTAVRVDEYRESEDPLFIRATIYVESGSQKAILIGRRGAAIRELGAASRAKIEAFVERRVYLDLWIKVLPRWRKDPKELKRFGFPVPEKDHDS